MYKKTELFPRAIGQEAHASGAVIDLLGRTTLISIGMVRVGWEF